MKKINTKTISSKLNKHLVEVHVFDSIDSTNIEAARHSNTISNYSVFTADEQTLGRGRKNHSFFSPNKTGVYYSLLIKKTLSHEIIKNITAITAVVTANVLENISKSEIQIKWVNDIYISDRKVCGILCETSYLGSTPEYTIIGIGINLFAPYDGFPEEIKDKTGYVLSSPYDENIKEELIIQLTDELINAIENYNKEYIFTQYQNRLLYKNSTIKVLSETKEYNAKLININKDFNLIVQTQNNEIFTLNSGEISIVK